MSVLISGEKQNFLVPNINDDPALKDRKLEQVEDLKSWIIIYVKLKSIKLI